MVATALLEAGPVLFLRTSPGDPPGVHLPTITVGGAGLLCLAVRIVVGFRSRSDRRSASAPGVDGRAPRS